MSEKLADILKMQGIKNETILQAIKTVDRSTFLPAEMKSLSDANQPLAIGHGQTCSQPYIVAKMSELLLNNQDRLKKVLEIGTGCGYQTAILSQFCDQIVTIERIYPLYQTVKKRFKLMEWEHIHCHYADGNYGWENESPYQGIIVTAAADKVPPALLEQLDRRGGRLVIPVGETKNVQFLETIDRHGDEWISHRKEQVIFVPLLSGVSGKEV